MNSNFKKYKLNKLQKIKQNYTYIYVFRYNDFKTNEMILIKKKIKSLDYNFLIIKQNISKKFFLNLKGQGSLLLCYSNSYKNLSHEIFTIKKLELIALISRGKHIYSGIKSKEILSGSNPTLNVNLIQPFLHFIYYLKNLRRV